MASPGAAVHSDSVVSPRNTENGLCQSVGALPHYLRDGDRLAGSAKICAIVFGVYFLDTRANLISDCGLLCTSTIYVNDA